MTTIWSMGESIALLFCKIHNVHTVCRTRSSQVRDSCCTSELLHNHSCTVYYWNTNKLACTPKRRIVECNRSYGGAKASVLARWPCAEIPEARLIFNHCCWKQVSGNVLKCIGEQHDIDYITLQVPICQKLHQKPVLHNLCTSYNYITGYFSWCLWWFHNRNKTGCVIKFGKQKRKTVSIELYK